MQTWVSDHIYTSIALRLRWGARVSILIPTFHDFSPISCPAYISYILNHLPDYALDCLLPIFHVLDLTSEHLLLPVSRLNCSIMVP